MTKWEISAQVIKRYRRLFNLSAARLHVVDDPNLLMSLLGLGPLLCLTPVETGETARA